jgi:two-component system nitrate/nitrite response regulator NarL
VVVRVLVIDQQPLFSRGLALLLPAVSDDHVQVVASTDLATEAAGLARAHRPDLALVDLGLAPPGGVRAIAAIRRVEPRMPVVAMTVDNHDEAGLRLAVEALAAGARSLLVKAQEPEDLLPPLLAAADGWAVLPQRVLDRLAGGLVATGPRRELRLTADERRLWTLLAGGSSTAQIAISLHVSERTVKRLTAALLRRLGVTNRTEAAVLAGRLGLLDAPAG